jgi:tryptophan synthase alpha chain
MSPAAPSATTPSTATGAVPPRVSIAETFALLRQRKQIALMPFVAAGFPDVATTRAVLPALEQAGASLIEVGFPFSDPIADGPVIQEAFTDALKHNIRVADVFACVADVRPRMSIPMVGMLSYSIVHRYGLERFVRDAKAAGLDGLILPDLPPPEAQRVCDVVRAGGLDTVLLIAPTTAPHRRKEIMDLCSGFVYYLSISGITGERDRLPADLEQNIRELKGLSDRPVCVGFGIHRAEHVAQLAGLADGAIVGTAVVRRMKEHLTEGPERIAAAVGDYCRELLSKAR